MELPLHHRQLQPDEIIAPGDLIFVAQVTVHTGADGEPTAGQDKEARDLLSRTRPQWHGVGAMEIGVAVKDTARYPADPCPFARLKS